MDSKSTLQDPPWNNPQPTRCMLLELPSELRNRIYEITLIQIGLIRLPAGRSESSKRALLATCRQIHDEAVGIYYSNNAFIADCGTWFLNTDIISWLRGLGQKKRSMLNDVRLSLRQQRLLSRACGLKDSLFFVTALVRRLIDLGIMTPSCAIRVEVGDMATGFEYLTVSELEARIGSSKYKATPSG